MTKNSEKEIKNNLRNQDSRRVCQNQDLAANQSMDAIGLVADGSFARSDGSVLCNENSGNSRVHCHRFKVGSAKSCAGKWCPCFGIYQNLVGFLEREKEINFYNERMRRVMTSEEKRDADWELIGST